MSKSRLRTEYEARMGKVDGTLELFNATGKQVYYESSKGYWARREYNEADQEVYVQTSTGYSHFCQYNDEGKQFYYEDSFGTVRDNRPNKAKIFTDEDGKQYKVVEVLSE